MPTFKINIIKQIACGITRSFLYPPLYQAAGYMKITDDFLLAGE